MRTPIFIWLLLIVFILLIIFPVIQWYVMEPVQLNIGVIDKTVPDEKYREHLGLFWLLNNLKIVNSEGDLYKLEEDYYGYDPYEQSGDTVFEIRDDFDLIYVTDTYGVYTADLEENLSGNRSTLIYGGMTIYEWNRIMASKTKMTTLIVEFNSLATPTSSYVREIMENNLSIDWTGWYGRYFPDLEDREVPEWLVDNYELYTGKTWDFVGEGIAFVNFDDYVVILDSEDFVEKVRFSLTEEGKSRYSLAENSYYNYWFNIVVPYKDVSMEAEFILNLNDSGKEKLNVENIPLQFPAIVHNENNKTYYFAGDFADVNSNYWAKWVLPITMKNAVGYFKNREEFFMKSYDPIITQILKDISTNK